MSKRRFVDTNLIVRYLVRDHEKHAKIATNFFEACDRGEITLVLLPEVLAECVFLLESFYKRTRNDISRTLSSLVSSPGVELTDAAIHLNALARYSGSKIHFVDCTIAAYSAAHGVSVATFDTDFRKFADVTVDLN